MRTSRSRKSNRVVRRYHSSQVRYLIRTQQAFYRYLRCCPQPKNDQPMPLFLTWFQTWRTRKRVQQITPEAARQRVARGAAYLDAVDPGWWQRLDAAVLELSCGQSCVLGQLHGGFAHGLSRAAVLNMGSAPRASLSPVSLGFLCVQDVAEVWQARDYALLNAAWQDEITRRRPPIQIDQLIRKDTRRMPGEPAPVQDEQAASAFLLHEKAGDAVDELRLRVDPVVDGLGIAAGAHE